MNSKRILAVIGLLSLPAALMNAGDIVKDTTDFDRNVASSPAELLKGEISGVRVSSLDGNPNGAFNVNIRGLNTLRGDSQPMWIVDGAVIGSSVNHNLNAFYLNGDITINGDLLPDYSGRSYTAPVGNFRWLNPYEIESIEIVKDMSQAAIYGMQGANGVIIVKTRKASSDKRSIRLSSNVGVNFSTQDGEAFRTGINHMHDIGINGMFGSNSWYSISGFLHQNTGAVKRTDSMVGGLAVSMETMANRIFHFGFNSFLSYGDLLSTGGTNHIGAPSTMVLSRHPDAFTDDTVSGWLSDYDDRVRDYRTVNSVWLKINFLKILGLKLTGGMDYQNQTRYIWFGPGTSFGKEYSGAAGILNNSLCTYNFKGELDFNMNFSVRHSVHASLAFDMNGNLNRTNAMCGTDFGMPYLRSKGLSSSGSLHAIRKFSRDYNETGAYLTLGYGFNGYAGINGTVRYDYNSRSDQEPTIFPAADAYVDFKRIFLKDSRTVSSLKLSGGWGSAGKETVLPYEYLDFWIYGVPDVDAGTENYYDGVNRLISREYNVGIEAGLVDGRFSFALKYYDKETDDSFRIHNSGKEIDGLWDRTSNISIIQERTSRIRNKGFELDADLDIIDGRTVKWNLWFNTSWNMNCIIALDALDAVTQDLANGTYTAGNITGGPVSQAYGYRTDGDGNVISENPEILGNTLPEISGGFGTSLSLYGLTVDVKFSGAAGFEIINANRTIDKKLDCITSDCLERGDYLRLDRLGLSYKIPLNVKWIREFKASLAAHNLFTATGYSGWNPDVNSFGVTVRSNGVDYGAFPLCRTVVLGVSFKF